MGRMTESESLESLEISIFNLTLPWPSGLNLYPIIRSSLFFKLIFLYLVGFFVYLFTAPWSFKYYITSPCFFVQQGLCFNKSLGFRKYPARWRSRESIHVTSSDNRQMCGFLSTVQHVPTSSAELLRRLCIICPLYMLHIRRVIMAKIILWRRSVCYYVKQQWWKNVEFEWRNRVKRGMYRLGGRWLWDWIKCISEGRKFINREFWFYVIYNHSDWNFQVALMRNRPKISRNL